MKKNARIVIAFFVLSMKMAAQEIPDTAITAKEMEMSIPGKGIT